MIKELFSPDQLKVMYRGNFTYKQAALYFGVSVELIKWKIEAGELGVNYVFRGAIRISKAECDKFLQANLKYRKKLR